MPRIPIKDFYIQPKGATQVWNDTMAYMMKPKVREGISKAELNNFEHIRADNGLEFDSRRRKRLIGNYGLAKMNLDRG